MGQAGSNVIQGREGGSRQSAPAVTAGDRDAGTTMKKIVAGIDGSTASYAAVKVGIQLLEEEGVLLAVDIKNIVTFYRDEAMADFGAALPRDPDFFEKQWVKMAEQVRDQVLKIPRPPTITVQWHIVTLEPGQGAPAKVLYDWAMAHKAEAIVVGSHQGPHLAENLFGSFPLWLISHSVLPTVIVHPPAASSQKHRHA